MIRFALLFLLGGFSTPSAFSQEENLKIAVASNLSAPVERIKALYEEDFESTLTLIVASSGKLTAQITNGAPYDLFMSADMKYPEKVYEAGLAQQKPTIFVLGTLHFWTIRSEINSIDQQLRKAKTIAIAQPNLAPYGAETRRWLQKQELWEEVKDKLVYGENISQVNQYIATKTVVAGFTSNSAQRIEAISQKGSWHEVPEAPPLPHGMVLLRNAEASQFAIDQFLEFMTSPVAQKVFQDFGYQLP
ncbi:MAG: molybdate ABC transporter substrate-binding protein [Bacteroidota bacterium]